jgi:hypothetical protein
VYALCESDTHLHDQLAHSCGAEAALVTVKRREVSNEVACARRHPRVGDIPY